MIPISKDQLLYHKIDGVTYSLLPPIGSLEIKLRSGYLDDDDDDLGNAKKFYPEAVKQLDKEYKGKRKPKKAEWTKLIQERLTKLLTEKNMDPNGLKKSVINEFNKNNNLINDILVGWKSKKDIPEFPKKDPASFLVMPIKNKLINWYWEQYALEEDELKN